MSSILSKYKSNGTIPTPAAAPAAPAAKAAIPIIAAPVSEAAPQLTEQKVSKVEKIKA